MLAGSQVSVEEFIGCTEMKQAEKSSGATRGRGRGRGTGRGRGKGSRAHITPELSDFQRHLLKLSAGHVFEDATQQHTQQQGEAATRRAELSDRAADDKEDWVQVPCVCVYVCVCVCVRARARVRVRANTFA